MRTEHPRGYSLVEVLVALALLSLLFLLAARLLLASRRMEASASDVAAGPRLGVLGVQLRRDIDSATAVAGIGVGWSSLPLQLALKDGKAVRYDFDGENLSRSVLLGGAALRRRVLVRGLRSFRWRREAGRMLYVKVSFPTRELGEGRASRPPGRPDTTWWIGVALRGSGWSRRW